LEEQSGGDAVLEALRIRDFRLLWFSRLVSLLGSWLLVVAVPAYVFTLTGSLVATGLTLAAEFLPPVVLGPVAGVLVDRWDRRRVMIAADVVRALAVALLLLARAPGDVWLVYLALVAESVGTVVFRPAAQAHTPAVVGTGTSLSSANALNGVTDGTVRLVGAPLGGALFGWAGFDLLVWLDIGTYLLSVAALLLTVPAVERRSGKADPVLAELRAGLAFLLTERTARALLLVNTLFLGANASLSALLVPYGISVLGGSGQTGVVMSALGVGFLLGAPLMRPLVDRMPPAYLLGGVLTATGAGFVLLFSATTLTTALPAAVLIGMTGSIALGTAQTTLQRVTPNEVLGRTSSALFTGEAVATLAGAVIGPAAAQALSVTGTAYLAGTAAVLSGLVSVLLLPRQRCCSSVRQSQADVATGESGEADGLREQLPGPCSKWSCCGGTVRSEPVEWGVTVTEALPESVTELPPYRAVLVVDTKEFGGNTDPGQQVLAEVIPDVVQRAFERAGLADVWDKALFPHNTGDGFGIGFSTRHLPAVVSTFFDTLQDVLAERHDRLRARNVRLRMRASLNVGPVRDPGHDGVAAVVGSTVITTHRLLDAQPVREVLTRSDPDQTFLSVALSQRVFDDVLASGYASLPASRVVPRQVRIKEFNGTVYLYVPKLSGDLLAHGVGEYEHELESAKAVQDTERPGAITNILTGGTHSGVTIQAGHIHGGVHGRHD
jgi:MFS family permease